jgi:hypothetical protein
LSYLAQRSQSVGPQALATEVAVHNFFDDDLSAAEKFIASAMVAAAKRGNLASGASASGNTNIQ